MTLPFSVDAWDRNRTIYQMILDMPFNRELASGALAEAKFKHYMVQDAHYLEGFARALSLASAKGHTADDVVHFAQAAQTAIIVERSLHSDYFQRFDITPEMFGAAEVSPACDHYVNYLLRIAALEPFEVTIAALLPCFWIYREVGKTILNLAASPNPYQAWIDTYAGVEFEQAVDAVIGVADRVGASASSSMREAMHRAFHRAVQHEWLFWDSAYKLKSWPI